MVLNALLQSDLLLVELRASLELHQDGNCLLAEGLRTHIVIALISLELLELFAEIYALILLENLLGGLNAEYLALCSID